MVNMENFKYQETTFSNKKMSAFATNFCKYVCCVSGCCKPEPAAFSNSVIKTSALLFN